MNNEASQPTCPSPKLRITLNPFLVTMLQAVAHAIHFKRILNFGEGQGAPVEFPNADPFFHNVFSLFEGKRFDLGLYEAGSSRTVAFDREGISYIFCNIHADMSGVVVALKTPYFGTSDRRGVIAIPNVPLGRYELRIWHERALPESLDTQTHEILISEASHSFGVLRLTEQRNTSQAHKNKYGQDYDNSTPAIPVYRRP